MTSCARDLPTPVSTEDLSGHSLRTIRDETGLDTGRGPGEGGIEFAGRR